MENLKVGIVEKVVEDLLDDLWFDDLVLNDGGKCLARRQWMKI